MGVERTGDPWPAAVSGRFCAGVQPTRVLVPGARLVCARDIAVPGHDLARLLCAVFVGRAGGPAEAWLSRSIDCAGILKLRNSDIELRKGETDIGRKNTRVRLVFRVHIPQPGGRTLSLQVASNPIECCECLSGLRAEPLGDGVGGEHRHIWAVCVFTGFVGATDPQACQPP